MSSIYFKINKFNKEEIQRESVSSIEATVFINNKKKCTVRAEKRPYSNARVMYLPLEGQNNIPEFTKNVKKFIENILTVYIVGVNNINEFGFEIELNSYLEDCCSLEE